MPLFLPWQQEQIDRSEIETLRISRATARPSRNKSRSIAQRSKPAQPSVSLSANGWQQEQIDRSEIETSKRSRRRLTSGRQQEQIDRSEIETSHRELLDRVRGSRNKSRSIAQRSKLGLGRAATHAGQPATRADRSLRDRNHHTARHRRFGGAGNKSRSIAQRSKPWMTRALQQPALWQQEQIDRSEIETTGGTSGYCTRPSATIADRSLRDRNVAFVEHVQHEEPRQQEQIDRSEIETSIIGHSSTGREHATRADRSLRDRNAAATMRVEGTRRWMQQEDEQ